MAITPEKITILDMGLKVYDLGTHLNVWKADGQKRIGMIEPVSDDLYRVIATGFKGAHGPAEGRKEALERLVRLWRISNPGAAPTSSDRKHFTILGEDLFVHSLRLCPSLVVWTVSGHPLGTLEPVDMLWRRGCAQEPQELEKALEDMVREWREDQGVTLVG